MSRLVDLSLTVQPGLRGVAFEPRCSVEKEGWNAQTLHLYSHSGTHMDAQVHFAAGEETIDQVSLDRCLGRAHVADLTPVKTRDLITVDSLGDTADLCQPGDGLLLRTDWSQHLEDAAIYRDGMPRISEDLARWCAERRIRLLGVEPPSVADVNNLEEVTRIHKILLGGNVLIVEGLTGLDRLKERTVFFGALPLKIREGDGCPCRAFAIENGGLTL